MRTPRGTTGRPEVADGAGGIARQKRRGAIELVVHVRKPKRLPGVMTRQEVKAFIDQLKGDKWLMASIMYGAGLRRSERAGGITNAK